MTSAVNRSYRHVRGTTLDLCDNDILHARSDRGEDLAVYEFLNYGSCHLTFKRLRTVSDLQDRREKLIATKR